MPLSLTPVSYSDLDNFQREKYNYAKIASLLADYGFMTEWVGDRKAGVDFIAKHVDGETILRVQLTGRACFYQKFRGKGLHIAFPHDGDWYLYPHDKALVTALDQTEIGDTHSWQIDGGYSFMSLNQDQQAMFEPYRVP